METKVVTTGTRLGTWGVGLSGKGNRGMYNQEEVVRIVLGELAEDKGRNEEYRNSISKKKTWRETKT